MYKCHKCGSELDQHELRDGLTTTVRTDLEPGTMTVQIDFECPECGEYAAQFTTGIGAFDEF